MFISYQYLLRWLQNITNDKKSLTFYIKSTTIDRKIVHIFHISINMGNLKCILCTPFSCCVGGTAVYDADIQDHRRTQLSGLDQAIRSINLGQNNYSPQVDDPDHDETTSEKSEHKQEQNSYYQSATLEPYKKP